MQRDQLKGKLERLIEELRVHGGNGLSVYGRRLRSEIAAIQMELDAGLSTPRGSRDDDDGRINRRPRPTQSVESPRHR